MLWLGIPSPSGRIADSETAPLRTALREIVERFGPDPDMTAQQDVLLANIRPRDRLAIENLLRANRVALSEDLTPMSRWAQACPTLATCGLALTEAEPVRAPLIARFETLFASHGLADERLSLRITGCPNGCARTYTGDIGLVGRVPESYAIYVGGDFAGARLSFKLHERVKEKAPEATLAPVVAAFANGCLPLEGFGDFCNLLEAEKLLTLT